jgi:hypothetical protein
MPSGNPALQSTCWTSPLAPRGELCPLEGIFTPTFTPKGEHYYLEEGRGEQIISPTWDIFNNRG